MTRTCFRTFHRKPHHGEFSQQSVSDWYMGSLLVLTLSLASRRRQIRNALIPRPLFARFFHTTKRGVAATNPPATEAQRTLNCKNDFFLDRRRQQPRRRRRRDDQQTDGRTDGAAAPARTDLCLLLLPRGAPLSHRPFPRSAAAGIRGGGGAAGRAIGERRADGGQRSRQRLVRAGATAATASVRLH